MILYARDQPTAQAAADAAFKRIQELNEVMSDYETDSELSRLSRTAGDGKAVKVSEELWFVLKRSQDLARRTDGAFDITVGPCVNLWRKARREKKMPDLARLAEARQAVGYQKIRLDPARRTALLLAPGMKLDLGGIAKGYAVDEALKVLRAHGVNRALVAGGGDMSAGDPPPGKPGWRIEIAALDTTNAPASRYVALARAALATSGDLFQRLEIDGKRYSHVVDPHTCIGLTDHSLVTIIARDCITADSLTKAVSVQGPEAGFELIAHTPGTAARMVRQPGDKPEVYESKNFRRYVESPAR